MNEEISKHIQIREILGLEGIEEEIISLIKKNKEEFKVFMSGGSSASGGGTSDHSALSNLDYASAGHTGFQPAGSYLTEESDPAFNAWLLATPPLYPGGWYDADQNTINLSGFNNDSGFITSYTDEKVKYDAGDATAGYIADKIIAGTGIGVAEGAGVNENKLVVSSTITQYTDALAVTAIKADAAWKATDWDTAYGWGNHADAGYVTGTPWTAEGYLTEETDPIFSAWDKSTGISITESQISDFGTYLTDITGESIGDLSDVTLTPTKTLTITESTTLSGGTHSGTNTGDQVIPDNEAGAANNFLTAYNNATGAWTKARPTWANIDKTTSDIADLTTKSHTSLSDIGTNTHAQIDTFIGTTVPTTYAPLVSPSFTTPTLGVAQATSVDVGNGSTLFGSNDDLTMTVTQHTSAPALNLYPAGGSLTSSRFAFRCVEGTGNFARFQGCTGTNAALASSNTMGIIEFAITQADPDPLKGVINFWTNNGDSIVLKATLNETGVFNAVGGFSDNGSAGIDTTFVDNDGNTITVKGGIITSKVAP